MKQIERVVCGLDLQLLIPSELLKIAKLDLVFPRIKNMLNRQLFKVASNLKPIGLGILCATHSSASRLYTSSRYEEEAQRVRKAQVENKGKENKQSLLDRISQEMLLTEIMRTMWVVLEQMFKPPYTIMYPFEKGSLSPRFRGEHALRRYPTGTSTSNCKARSVVSLVNCAKQSVQLKPSQLKQSQEMMGAERLRVMTST